MWDAIERGERQVQLETTFVGEAADFVVVGIPDATIFDDSKPELIFDRKTTSIPGRLFKNQRIQVWLYGYMVQSLGFETDDLDIAILSHERRLDPEAGKGLQELVLSGELDFGYGQNQVMEDPEARLHYFEYDSADHLEDLNWALEYWREEREPLYGKRAVKRRSCTNSDEIVASLV